jgi:small subunit ribosomal protein S4e
MHTKRIASGYGKEKKWITTPNPGPHPKDQSIPLLTVVRDLLVYADTSREAKQIIHDGLVLVDKKIRRDHKFGVGLMDVVELPRLKKCFRVMPAKKGIILKEIDEKESKIKLCKIIDKNMITAGITQLTLHDGSSILSEKGDYKTKDTLVLELPARTISDVIKFEKGNTSLVVRGRHSGKAAKIKEITDGTATRKSITALEGLQTLTDYMLVIGREKPLIKT